MTIDNEKEEELEDFIGDWYWDDKSHKFAHALGRFIFQFLDHLEQTGISEKTLRKHMGNCQLIGHFECQYGYQKQFIPSETFIDSEASHESVFKRKVSDSSYAITSYRSTWKKLYKFAETLEKKG